MHRLPSSSSIFRFRCSSLLLWLSVLCFLSGLVVMAYGFFHSRNDLVVSGSEVVAAGLTADLLEWAVSRRASPRRSIPAIRVCIVDSSDPTIL